MMSVSVVSQGGLGADVYVGWGEAELIETGSWGPAEVPQVAMDGSGNAIAVWSQSDGTRYNIWANLYVVGTGWGAAELIETNDAGDAYTPQVAVHESGNATATWSQWDGAFYNIWANQYVVGTGWGTPELVETDGDSYSTGPLVVIDPSGNVTVMWARSYDLLESPEDVLMNRYVDGSWGTPRELDLVDEIVSSRDLAVDDNGNVTFVWTQYVDYHYRIYYSRYYPSSDWSYPFLLSDLNAGYSANPCVAFDDYGRGIAVWQGDDSSCPNITSRRYVIGSGWGPLEPLETFDDDATSPQIAMDGSGNATVVWVQSGVLPGLYHIFSNRYVVGVGWGTAEPVEAIPGQARNPHVAMDGSGNAIAVWQEYDGMVLSIFAARYVVGEGWGEPELLETVNAGTAQYPKVAVDGPGNAIAVWEQDDGTRFNIYSSRYAIPDVTPPSLSLDSPSDGTTTETPTVVVSGATEPGASLVVNGILVAVGSDGSFSCTIALVDGDNAITATATDASGNSATVTVSVTYLDPVQALEDQLSDIEAELAALQDDLDSITDELVDLRDELNGTSSELTDVEAELAALQDELDSIMSELAGYLDELESLSGELNGTDVELADLQDELGSLMDELNGTSSDLGDLEAELGLVRDDLSSTSDDLDAAKTRILLLMALLAVFVVFAVVMVVMYIRLKGKIGGTGGAGG